MNKAYLLSLLIFALSLASCNPTDDESTPPPFTVAGIVSDEQGNPLPGVFVNSVVGKDTTDGAGYYSVVSFPTGGIEYTKDGYENWVESVTSRNEINVTLLKSDAGGQTAYESSFRNVQCEDGSNFMVEEVTVKDFGQGTGTKTWTRDKVWILKNKVFVNEGQTLSIEAGTIIKGGSGQVETTCVLVVARGGKILAEGTPELPIIFTAESDAIMRGMDGSLCTGSNLSADDKGLWGGVILLGKARLNSLPGETQIEGIPDTEPRGLYGGNDDADNSGSLRYVSIRHCGTEITIGNEVNGLTLGGAGNQTSIEYVETFACDDDGFEFFGGTVNTKYLASAFNGDDAFDYDEGWRGMNQFWLAYQAADADRGGEHDGGTDPETGTPFATPIISNATFIGSNSGNGKRALTFRDNAAGEYHNSVFLRYAFGVDIEFLGENAQDSYKNLKDGLLIFKNNLLSDIANQPLFTLSNQSNLPNNDPAVADALNFAHSYFDDAGNGNALSDPGLNVSFVPGSGSAASEGGSAPAIPFFEKVAFKGCFAPSEPRWLDGWTRVASEF